MSDPATFQQAFGAALADGEGLRDRALARALIIHRNTSAKSAQDALADNYPVIRALTGADAFSACARAYAEACPPREPTMFRYGAGFDGFLSAWTPFAGLPYLADVAKLERLHIEALFAADAPSLTGEEVADRLDLEAPIRLHPATRFARFDSPAADIWRAHQEDGELDALDGLKWSPGAALVTRPGHRVLVTNIDEATVAFLDACAVGRALGAAAVVGAEAGGDIAQVFSILITAGAFAQRAP